MLPQARLPIGYGSREISGAMRSLRIGVSVRKVILRQALLAHRHCYRRGDAPRHRPLGRAGNRGAPVGVSIRTGDARSAHRLDSWVDRRGDIGYLLPPTEI